MSEQIKVKVYEDLPTSLKDDMGRVERVELYHKDQLDQSEEREYFDALTQDPRLAYLHKKVWTYMKYSKWNAWDLILKEIFVENSRSEMNHIQYDYEISVDEYIKNEYQLIEQYHYTKSVRKILAQNLNIDSLKNLVEVFSILNLYLLGNLSELSVRSIELRIKTNWKFKDMCDFATSRKEASQWILRNKDDLLDLAQDYHILQNQRT